MLDTWTSLVLVSRPDTTLTRGAGSQPTSGASAGGQHELPHCGDPGGRVTLGHRRGEPGAGEAVAALRVVLVAQADREPDAEPVERGAEPLVVAAEPAD